MMRDRKGGPTAITLQDSHLRCWFAAICQAARDRVENGSVPTWLEGWMKDDFVGPELDKAGLGRQIEPLVISYMLGLYQALGDAEPRSQAEVRKDLKRLIKSVKRSWRPQLDKVLPDVESELRGEGIIIWDAAGQEPVSVEWSQDALNDLQEALDTFVEKAEAAEGRLERCGPGARPEVTTLAIMVLVNTCLDQKPSIQPSALVRLTETLLGSVIEEYNGTGSAIPEPDWDDRVREILETHRAA